MNARTIFWAVILGALTIIAADLLMRTPQYQSMAKRVGVRA